MASTKTSRRKIVRSVQAGSYGIALQKLGVYGIPTGPTIKHHGTTKKYGKHRKMIADTARQLRFTKRHRSGIMPSSKSVRGIQSIR